MIEIHCPNCGKEMSSCRDAQNGIVHTECNEAILTDIEKSLKKHKITDILKFSEHMPTFSFLYSGTPSQSRVRIWAALCMRDSTLNPQGVDSLLRSQIAAANEETDRRLAKERDLAPQMESETATAIEKIKSKFQKLAAAA